MKNYLKKALLSLVMVFMAISILPISRQISAISPNRSVTIDANGGKWHVTYRVDDHDESADVDVLRQYEVFENDQSFVKAYATINEVDVEVFRWELQRPGYECFDYSLQPDGEAVDTRDMFEYNGQTLYAKWAQFLKYGVVNANGGQYVVHNWEEDHEEVSYVDEVEVLLYDEGQGRIRTELSIKGLDGWIDWTPLKEGFIPEGYIINEEFVYAFDDIDFENGATFTVAWATLVNTITIHGNGGTFRAYKWNDEAGKMDEAYVNEVVASIYEYKGSFTTIGTTEGFEGADTYPENEDKFLIGFATSKDGGIIYQEFFEVPTDVHELYAIWASPTRAITVNPNGGVFITRKWVEELGIEEEGTLDKLVVSVYYDGKNYFEAPVNNGDYDYVDRAYKEGYRSVGYSLTPDGPYYNNNLEKIPEGIDTVYVVWEEAVEVTFDPNGGKFDYEFDGSYTEPRAEEIGVGFDLDSRGVTFENHYFAGWYSEKDGGERVDVVPDKDITVYAHWTSEQVFNIIYDIPAGMILNGDPVYTATLEELTAGVVLPVADGDFAGWDAETRDYALSTSDNKLRIVYTYGQEGHYDIVLVPRFVTSIEDGDERLETVQGHENVVLINLEEVDDLEGVYVQNNTGKTLVLKYDQVVLIVPVEQTSPIAIPSKDYIHEELMSSGIELEGNIEDIIDYDDLLDDGCIIIILPGVDYEPEYYSFDEEYLTLINDQELTGNFELADAIYFTVNLGYINLTNYLDSGSFDIREGKKLSIDIDTSDKFLALENGYEREFKLLHRRHDGSVEIITRTPNQYGNYLKVNGDKVTVVIDQVSPFMLLHRDKPIQYSVPDTAAY